MTELVERIRALAEKARDGDFAAVAVAELELRHLLADNRDAILAALEAREWRDIAKELPEDGQAVLIWSQDCIQPREAWRAMSGGEYRWYVDRSGRSIDWSPTHWLPLPTPATEGEA